MLFERLEHLVTGKVASGVETINSPLAAIKCHYTAGVTYVLSTVMSKIVNVNAAAIMQLRRAYKRKEKQNKNLTILLPTNRAIE